MVENRHNANAKETRVILEVSTAMGRQPATIAKLIQDLKLRETESVAQAAERVHREIIHRINATLEAKKGKIAPASAALGINNRTLKEILEKFDGVIDITIKNKIISFVQLAERYGITVTQLKINLTKDQISFLDKRFAKDRKRILRKSANQKISSVGHLAKAEGVTVADLRKVFGKDGLKIIEENILRRRKALAITQKRRIPEERIQRIISEARRNQNIWSLEQLKKTMGISNTTTRNLPDYVKDIMKEIFRQRVLDIWEKLIIDSYGSITEAKKKANRIGIDDHKKRLERRGLDVNKAIETGQLKLKHDLMIVLKKNKFNKTETARAFGVKEDYLKKLLKRFNISKETIGIAKLPFAVSTEVIERTEIQIRESRFNRRISRTRTKLQARHRMLSNSPVASPEDTKKALKKLNEFESRVKKLRKKHNIPEPKQIAGTRSPIVIHKIIRPPKMLSRRSK